MTNDGDKIPSQLVERLLDRSDQAFAKELSDLENIIATLVTQLSNPPRREDIDRSVKEVHKLVEESCNKKLVDISNDLNTVCTSEKDIALKIDGFIYKIKWVAGVITVLVGISIAVITYVTTITEKSIDANVAVKIKEIEEKYEEASKQRQEEFKRIIEEIKQLRSPVPTNTP